MNKREEDSPGSYKGAEVAEAQQRSEAASGREGKSRKDVKRPRRESSTSEHGQEESEKGTLDKLSEKREYNRRSAAKARQRVKEQLAELSDLANLYQSKCDKLQAKNQKLRADNLKIMEENQSLVKKLEDRDNIQTAGASVADLTTQSVNILSGPPTSVAQVQASRQQNPGSEIPMPNILAQLAAGAQHHPLQQHVSSNDAGQSLARQRISPPPATQALSSLASQSSKRSASQGSSSLAQPSAQIPQTSQTGVPVQSASISEQILSMLLNQSSNAPIASVVTNQDPISQLQQQFQQAQGQTLQLKAQEAGMQPTQPQHPTASSQSQTARLIPQQQNLQTGVSSTQGDASSQTEQDQLRLILAFLQQNQQEQNPK